jgi:hypothetical protein
MFGKSLSDIRLKMGVTPRSLPKINFKIIHCKGKEHRNCFTKYVGHHYMQTNTNNVNKA